MSPTSLPDVPTLSGAVGLARRASTWRYMTDLGRRRLEGPPVAPERGIGWLAQTLVDRILDKWDAVVMWTGEERSSKSTGIMRVLQAVEARLMALGTPVPFDFANLCYRARPLNDAYRRAVRTREYGRQFWYDEGGRGILAGETFDPEQVVITRLLQQAGVANAILYIAIPDPFTLAKKVRGRRAVFWVDTVSRGTERKPAPSKAEVFERDRRRHFQPTSNIGFSQSRRCPELTYLPYPVDDPFWVRYEAHKIRNLDDLFDENDRILDRHEAKMLGKTGEPTRGARRE